MAHVRHRPRHRPLATAAPAMEPQNVDYSADPILQQIRALAAQNNASAEAAAAAARTQALIRFGYDPSAQSLYGAQGSSTQQAAEQNPFSVLSNLARGHTQRQKTLNENLNKRNLFYSSYRGQQLQNESTQYLGEQAQAQQALRDQLAGISQGTLATEQGNQERVSSAEQDAYARALQASLASGGLGPPHRRRTPGQRLRHYGYRGRV